MRWTSCYGDFWKLAVDWNDEYSARDTRLNLKYGLYEFIHNVHECELSASTSIFSSILTNPFININQYTLFLFCRYP